MTSDNPRSEDPEAIIAEIVAGVPAERRREAVAVEPDRRAAIGRALRRGAPGDVVVIAGKGHEQGQILGDRRHRLRRPRGRRARRSRQLGLETAPPATTAGEGCRP